MMGRESPSLTAADAKACRRSWSQRLCSLAASNASASWSPFLGATELVYSWRSPGFRLRYVALDPIPDLVWEAGDLPR